MYGMNRNDGSSLNGSDHLQQSINDILTTRLGSRVMRPLYGSKLPELLDKPFNEDTKIDMIAATADAINTWEPRLKITSVIITFNNEVINKPVVYIDIKGTNLDTDSDANLETIKI